MKKAAGKMSVGEVFQAFAETGFPIGDGDMKMSLEFGLVEHRIAWAVDFAGIFATEAGTHIA